MTFLGAGDIASCALPGDEQTARLLDAIPGSVFTAGDNAYERGTAAEFRDCYGPTWGRHKDRTRPAAGSHEYQTPGARPYFDYFGAAAGPPDRGYYGYDVGDWHVVVLNSNCGIVPCGAGTAQEAWLRQDLAARGKRCTLAIWHHPLFSSGDEHGSDPITRPFWRALYEAGADVVVVGHDHHYERFAPQDPDGRVDEARGLREFLVGTGGASLRGARRAVANSQFVRTGAWGVLRFTLRVNGYDWEFVPVAGDPIDRGSASCHSGT